MPANAGHRNSDGFREPRTITAGRCGRWHAASAVRWTGRATRTAGVSASPAA